MCATPRVFGAFYSAVTGLYVNDLMSLGPPSAKETLIKWRGSSKDLLTWLRTGALTVRREIKGTGLVGKVIFHPLKYKSILNEGSSK